MKKTALLMATMAAGGIGSMAPVRELAAQDPTEKKTYTVPHVLEVVGKTIAQQAPTGLSAADQKSYSAQTEWLKSVRTRVEAMGTKTGVLTSRDAATGQASGRRQYEPIQVQKEIEALQKAIEAESRQFTALSNVMKTRHDTVMSAIRNIRA
jgi:hypothetical protein